jgi:hypothetical protein
MNRSTTSVFLAASWRDLVSFNYEVDPQLLQPFVPAGTYLDTFDERAFVSLVAFRFLDTRVLSLPIPFHRDFTEVNLRCYVRRPVDGDTRRGVVFLREMVPRRAVATVARLLYNEPYVVRPMRHEVSATPPPRVAYHWRHDGSWQGCSAQALGAGAIPDPESLERFLTDKPWGYTRQRDGGTIEYQVEHPPWAVWHAVQSEPPVDFTDFCDPPLANALRHPDSVLIADGSAVTVSSPRRI